MKSGLATLALIALVLVSASAYHRFNFQDEDDMIKYMTDEDHHVYVLFFYNGDHKSTRGEVLKKRNDDERMRIQNTILDAYAQVAYADIEVSSGKFDHAIEVLGIDKPALDEFPAIAVVTDGNGKWVAGPNSTTFAEGFVKDFSSEDS